MDHQIEYWAYELGAFLVPEEDPIGNFFLLLQNPVHYCENGQGFMVKLGKYRYLDGEFQASCRKVLVYRADKASFTLCDIELEQRKDGTRYFDAVAFLDALGLKYRMNDTSHYRYFKARLYKSIQHLKLDESAQKVGLIQKAISEDDRDVIRWYPCSRAGAEENVLSFAETGFYFLSFSNSAVTNYRNLIYCSTEKELREYLRDDFGATDGAEIVNYPLERLLEGVEYEAERRMGCGTDVVHCQAFHGELRRFYRILDQAEVFHVNGEPLKLSRYLQRAKTEAEIKKIVDAYNAAWENVW